MNVGVISHLFPTRRRPAFGSFVRTEIDSLSRFVDIRLFAPRPRLLWFEGNPFPPGVLPYPLLRPHMVLFPRWFLQGRSPVLYARTIERHRDFFAGCDLVHAHTAFPDGAAAIYSFSGFRPVVITLHGGDINQFARVPALRKGIIDTLERADAVIAVSDALIETVRTLGITRPVTVIPNGIDTMLFTPGDRVAACQSLGLDPGRPRLLYAGNFAPVKNVPSLIEAFAEILKVHPACELVLLGEIKGDDGEPVYRPLIRRLGIGASVRIHPSIPHPELPAWMRASNLLVLPSLSEGFGLVLAEALACGIPVVATRCGGPEMIVTDGLGILTPPRDSGALAEALLTVLAGRGIVSPDLIAASARSRFSTQAIAAQIVEVYQTVLGESW